MKFRRYIQHMDELDRIHAATVSKQSGAIIVIAVFAAMVAWVVTR